MLTKKASLANLSGCVPLPTLGSLLVLMTHGKLNWLLFPSPSVSSCAIRMDFGTQEVFFLLIVVRLMSDIVL